MSRTALSLVCLIAALGGLVVIARAQDAGDGAAAGDYRQSVLKREPTPAKPRTNAYRSVAEPTPATRPAEFQSTVEAAEPTSNRSGFATRPSAAERLQQVREATNRPSTGKPFRSSTVTGPVTADPTEVQTPRVAEQPGGPDLISPSRSGTSVGDTNTSSGSILKQGDQNQDSGSERPTARRLLRSKSGTSSGLQSLSAPATIPSDAASRAVQSQTVIQSRGPALRIETEGPKSMKLGTESTYTIHVRNDGEVEANDVFVRVGVPLSAKVIAEGALADAGQAADNQEQRFVWTISNIPPRGHETLTLKITPTTGEPLDLFVDWTTRPVSAVAQIEVQQPQLEMSVFGPKDIAYGEAARYTIRLSNPGSGDADNVIVEFGYGQERLEPKQVGTLAAGQQQEISLELTARQAGALPVVATASADGGLRAEASQEVLVRRASLETQIAGDAAVFAGSPATYRVVVRNAGNAPANQVVAVVSLPEGAKLMRSGDEATVTRNELTWEVGTLAANGERTLEIQAQLNAAGDNAINVRVQGATELESNGSFVTKVEALADLKLSVNDPQGPVAVGQDALYEIHIHNHGTKAATKINVVAQFSAGIEPVEATGVPAELVPGQVLFQPVPRIDPGQEVTLIVRARADNQGPKRFRVEVACEELDIQLVAQETTHFFTDGTVTKSAAKPAAAKR